MGGFITGCRATHQSRDAKWFIICTLFTESMWLRGLYVNGMNAGMSSARVPLSDMYKRDISSTDGRAQRAAPCSPVEIQWKHIELVVLANGENVSSVADLFVSKSSGDSHEI